MSVMIKEKEEKGGETEEQRAGPTFAMTSLNPLQGSFSSESLTLPV